MLRGEAGHIIITPDGAGDGLRLMTKRCVHCGQHWTVRPSNDIKKALTPLEVAELERQGKTVRGFCHSCNGPICGLRCIECVPLEKRLEIAEGNVSPTAVRVFGGF